MNSFNFSANQSPIDACDAWSQQTDANRQQLEQLWQSTAPEPAVAARWQKIGRWLLAALTDSQQVRVWTRITPAGTKWYAYDPQLGRSVAYHSEDDLRAWLEQRHR
ncbi:MAG: hypothetical protein WA885_15780 [Phormidesmis sp.]